MKYRTLASVLFFSMIYINGYAGNTAVNSLGFKGTAMQAFVAVADDPSAIYYNPAGITQIKQPMLETNIELYHPNVKYENSNNNTTTTSNPYAISPNVFFVTPINNDWYFGIGLYTPFARSTDYDTNAATYNSRMRSTFLRTDLVPTLAWQVTPYLSVALSAVISYGEVKLDVLGQNESADGFGATAQIGALWKVTPTFQIGLDYRGPEVIHMDGSGSSSLASGDFTTDVKYPGVLSAGFAWQLLPKWLISFQYDYEMWSYVQGVTRYYGNTGVTNSIDAHNSSNYRLGTAYTINDKNKVFAGMSYNQAAIPADNLVPAVPDYDAVIASLGYSYTLNQWQFNLAYEFAYLISRTSNATGFFNFAGQYYGYNQHIVLGINYLW
ncbi:MAG: hypothetical protein EP298_09365 [Gammaproteobacteria bacterium]|nr:MAG: hypothetical protein EP298_09365 [Gammaproteobacteria bacterium]UTW42311.1 outer membrane protein transport protein [bacterium SCSIO 12844]